jgi:predicted ATPase
MKRYILTGTPGAGKTALLRLLEGGGYPVVEEAATDVIALEQARGIAEPWRQAGFIDTIVELQRRRQIEASRGTGDVQFFDRSPICTYALSRFLEYPPSAILSRELERIARERIYQTRVFFVQNLGFCTPTDARRISFEDSLRFEQVHADAYRALGYDCVVIPPADLARRLEMLTDALARIQTEPATRDPSDRSSAA